jgi:hypothetical protein
VTRDQLATVEQRLQACRAARERLGRNLTPAELDALLGPIPKTQSGRPRAESTKSAERQKQRIAAVAARRAAGEIKIMIRQPKKAQHEQ